MLLSTSISIFLKHFECEEIVEILSKAGFDAMDFSFYDEKYYCAETDSDEFKEYFLKLRHIAEKKGMCFNQAHAPFPSNNITDDAWTSSRFEDIVRSMRNASYLGVPVIVVHTRTHLPRVTPCVLEKEVEEAFAINMDFYRKLIPYCKKYRIKIAIENLYHRVGNDLGMVNAHGITSKPERVIQYMETLDSEWITGCLDTGHAFLVREEPADFIRALGPERLRALHIHDVDGILDTHTLPYYGIIDWDSIMSALKEIGYQGDFTFESESFLRNLPRELMPEAAKFMAQVGRYLMRKVC